MKLAKFSFICFVFLFIVLMFNFAVGATTKKCSRTLRRIPVHKDFDLEKFSGTWYTIRRTTWAWGKETYESFSIEISKHEDGTFHYSYTGKTGDKCLPVESGVLEEQARAGSYFMRGSGSKKNHATLIVSFTDYRQMALMYYCYKYRPGSQRQCLRNGMQVEVASRSTNPDVNTLNGYIKRANKRLCAPLGQLVPTVPGQCKIPEILEAARLSNLQSSNAELEGEGPNSCAVNNIPVQDDFDSAQLHGLWYEIARTRFTFNKMESVVNFHRYDDQSGKIYSYYTGTVISPTEDNEEVPCLPAIHGMSIVRHNAGRASDRMGRIGWDDSTYPWSPLKVLYADDNYILFYSCFAGPSDQQCPNNMMEVTLSGRSRDITDEKKASIFSILSEICVDPSDLIETQMHANCTSWVSIETDQVKPEDLKLEEIPMLEDFDKEQIQGHWYQYGSISFNNATSLEGVVMEKTIAGYIEVVITKLSAFLEDGTCGMFQTTTRDMCVDSSHQITVLPKGGDGKFVFNKILYLDDQFLVEYTCAKLTLEGTCDRKGIMFNVYTKNFTDLVDDLDEDTTDLVNKLAISVYLDPDSFVKTTEWCFFNEDDVSDDVDSVDDDESDGAAAASVAAADTAAAAADDDDDNAADDDNGDADSTGDTDDLTFDEDCDIDRIATVADIDDYVQEEVYGYWYEVARSTDNQHLSDSSAVVAYFTSANNETLNIYYTGLVEEGDGTVCSDISHASLLARCETDFSGDYLARFSETENYVSYVPFKVIYTDYTSVLVTYTCQNMTESGVCTNDGVHIRIWSRNSTIDEDSLAYAYGMCLWACVDPEKEGYFQKTETENNVCLIKLEGFVTENDLENTMNLIDDEDDYDEPRDQGQRDQLQLDLEAALAMDDDEFYYN